MKLLATDEPDGPECDADVRTVAYVDEAHAGYTDVSPYFNPRIRLNWNDQAQASWSAMVAHELGHALGADDASDPNMIMFPKSTEKNLRVTKRDVEATGRF